MLCIPICSFEVVISKIYMFMKQPRRNLLLMIQPLWQLPLRRICHHHLLRHNHNHSRLDQQHSPRRYQVRQKKRKMNPKKANLNQHNHKAKAAVVLVSLIEDHENQIQPIKLVPVLVS
mmetsp:Transcript_120713/g.346853  ORF Transcript_120713/g.346853 Transcript_120713/m.346853 type:complete len:118 (+) Transcript_120713:404-757(+)